MASTIGAPHSFTESGYSLTEVVVALAAVCVVVLMIGAIFNSGFSSTNMFERVTTRDEIQRDLVRALSNSRALGNSCRASVAFATCFQTGGACVGNGDFVEFNFFDETNRQIGGTTGAPVFFSRAGEIVAANDPRREFQVITSFRAQGYPQQFHVAEKYKLDPAAAPPAGALHELLIIRYQILPAFANPADVQNPAIALASRTGSITLSLQDNFGPPAAGCPAPWPL